jgi:hypothetical protein
MLSSTDLCGNPEPRREEIRRQKRNGIDFVEVSDNQRSLYVHFFGKAPATIEKENVRIDGGRRIRQIRVLEIRLCVIEAQELDDCMEVFVDRPGDFSTYTLRLVKTGTDEPYEGFDERYAQATFSFKVNCPSDLDCAAADVCPVTPLFEPEINYLAKDYASFRQLMLDRLALIMPSWTESHVPDLGITVIEILAYVGDYLSYYQDAVATEAYLSTARQRISVRRHARLIDYQMHEGCNARAWVCLNTSVDQTLVLQNVYFVAGQVSSSASSQVVLTPADLPGPVSLGAYEAFEPMAGGTVQLVVAHQKISFYTWGERECCLPAGTTAATLRDCPAPDSTAGAPPTTGLPPRQLKLQAGDLLVFEEVLGPKTGNQADADPAHRHVVRLTSVTPAVDTLYQTPVLEIEWAVADALPFPLCLACTGPALDCDYLTDVSVARGNVLLVDHGQTIKNEDVGTVLGQPDEVVCGSGGPVDEVPALPLPFTPTLKYGPLTFSQSYQSAGPAAQALQQDVRQAVPDLTALTGTRQQKTSNWVVRPDLLNSQSGDNHVVVEIDNDGDAHLRFGDGDLGRIPPADTVFTATYRVGNGPTGNVGAEAICYIVARSGAVAGITAVRNPLPAQGGTLPEPLAEVKLYAPGAFQKQLERAITAADYARLAKTHDQVEAAAATLQWLGSWYEALVAIQPVGTDNVSPELLDQVTRYLQPYRRIGHDVKVVPAEYIPLNLELFISIKASYLRGHVEAALLDRFSNRLLPNGQRGYFYPDNLTFGEDIPLTKLVAAAQAVPGVASVDRLIIVARDQRYVWPPSARQLAQAAASAQPAVTFGPLQIARLDNDPSFPENGTLKLRLRGGR